jgi:argininosuccinate synthase
MPKEKIAVAYSGGLDTSVIVKWLQEKFDAEVITVTANLGQKKELIGVEEKAYKTGAKKVFILDLQEEFAIDFIFPRTGWGALRVDLSHEHLSRLLSKKAAPLWRMAARAKVMTKCDLKLPLPHWRQS